MAIGKNKRKRLARAAFRDDPNAFGDMPYSFKVVEYRRADDMALSMEKQIANSGMVRRVLTFASLSAYKKYRKEFFSRNPTGTLSLASCDDETVRDTGKAFRSKVINKGADTSKAKPKALLQFKGNALVQSAKGKRFRPEGFPVSDAEVWQADNRKPDDVRQYDSKALQAIRLKYKKI